jgi:hypothetical protein
VLSLLGHFLIRPQSLPLRRALTSLKSWNDAGPRSVHMLDMPLLSEPSFPSWSSSTKNIQRQLPPPTSFAQITPPKTSEMSTSSPYGYRPSHVSTETNFPVRSQGCGMPSQAQQSYPYYTKQPAPTIREPPTIQALVMPDPPERRKSPSSSSSSVAPALQLPETIHAPQASLPQLAAEVRTFTHIQLRVHMNRKQCQQSFANLGVISLPRHHSWLKPRMGQIVR